MERDAEDSRIPIVGPLVGQFLYQIARVSRSKRILEVGMAIGYSTIWLAQAAKRHKGNVTSIEIDPEMVESARRNLREAKLNDIVRILVGNAVEIVGQLRSKFDLMFIDADKTDYPRLLHLLSPLMKTGTILLADNTLWGGAVASDDSSEATTALRRFNELVATDPSLESVIVPIRDGVTFALRR
jgi:predicted O-methyltransferase YrrM